MWIYYRCAWQKRLVHRAAIKPGTSKNTHKYSRCTYWTRLRTLCRKWLRYFIYLTLYLPGMRLKWEDLRQEDMNVSSRGAWCQLRLYCRFLSAICERFRMFRFFDVSRKSIISDDDGTKLRKDFSYKRKLKPYPYDCLCFIFDVARPSVGNWLQTHSRSLPDYPIIQKFRLWDGAVRPITISLFTLEI